MSDVANAPAPAPSAPPANEVVVDQNPVSAPQPIGSQAPQAPTGDIEGSKHRPESRREAIQKAFEKARAAQEEPKKPATARAPKEDKAKLTEPEMDLRKPPQKDRYREQGRFAREPGAEQQQSAQPDKPAAQPAQRINPLPETAPYREPLPRMSEQAKAEWHAAPESVRGAVHQMAQEFDGAYKKYREDHEEMESIRNFHDLAKQHGTSLNRALTNYVGMEMKLRENPLAGLDQIVNNLNLRTSDGHKITLRDVAYHVLSQTPEQLNAVQMQNAGQAQSAQIGQLHQLVGDLRQDIQKMHYERQFTQTRSAVDQFADTHPRFDELGDLILQELRLGFGLEEAYQRADRLRPSTRAAQTRTTPAQTRSDKSIHGAPEAGSTSGPTRRKDDKPVGRREAIQNAIRRVNGGL